MSKEKSRRGKQRKNKKENVEAVATDIAAVETEPEVASGSAPAAPALSLHPEVIEFLAGLLVEEMTADGEVRS